MVALSKPQISDLTSGPINPRDNIVKLGMSSSAPGHSPLVPSNSAEPVVSSEEEAWRYILGVLHFGKWVLRFLIAKYITPLLAQLMLALILLELLIPGGESARALHELLHWFWPKLARTPLDSYLHALVKHFDDRTLAVVTASLAVLSVLVAIFMVLHHKKLIARIHADTNVLKTLRRTLEDGVDVIQSSAKAVHTAVSAGASSATMHEAEKEVSKRLLNQFVDDTLQRLAGLHPDKDVVVILETSADKNDGFDIYAQHGSYEFSKDNLSQSSAAGYALNTHTVRSGVKHGLVYTPYAQYPQAALLWTDEASSSLKWAMIREAFVQLSLEHGTPPKSSACFEIKFKKGTMNNKKYVLCWDSKVPDSFREQHFQALWMAAHALGMVLNEIEIN